MSSINLQLTATGRHFSLSPLPGHLYADCTADEPCGARASHRLLLRRTASVRLLCDTHTVEWARDHGVLSAAPAADSRGAAVEPGVPMHD